MASETRSIALVLVVLGIALAGGFARLWFDSPKFDPITAKSAATLVTTCFTGHEIPANTAISVAGLSLKDDEISPKPARTFAYSALEAITVDALDPALREKLGQAAPVLLPKSTEIRVSKGEFTLASGSFEARRSGGRPLVVRATETVRFKPADNTNYIVRLELEKDIELPAPGAGASRTLPAGTKGTLTIPVGRQADGHETGAQLVQLATLHPLLAKPWLAGTSATLVPLRAAGRGLGDLSIEARQAGLNFGTAGLTLNSCAWTRTATGDDPPRVAGVAETKPGSLGMATVIVTVPSDILPVFSPPTGLKWWNPIALAIASSDGQYAGYGAFTAVDRGWAGIIATVFIVLLFIGLSSLRYQQLGTPTNTWLAWFTGLFAGPDRDPSLSLFQIFFWTVITVWGLAYVYIVTGNLLTLTASMMWLLGIAGTGSVLARWLGVGTSEGTSAAAPGAAAPSQPFEFGRMLATNGHFDLLKLQLFVFTLMIGIYVVWRITDTGAFPELDNNTLLLLGISQGVYIGGKVTGTTALTRAQTFKLELDLLKDEQKKTETNIEALKKQQKGLEDKRAAGTTLKPEEDTELKTLPGDIKVRQDKLTEIATKITAAETSLKGAMKEIGLPVT